MCTHLYIHIHIEYQGYSDSYVRDDREDSVLQCVAVCCSVLQCVAVCVAVCCSVLQCVAVRDDREGSVCM